MSLSLSVSLSLSWGIGGEELRLATLAQVRVPRRRPGGAAFLSALLSGTASSSLWKKCSWLAGKDLGSPPTAQQLPWEHCPPEVWIHHEVKVTIAHPQGIVGSREAPW